MVEDVSRMPLSSSVQQGMHHYLREALGFRLGAAGITGAEIAQAAGVSTAAISRFLNGKTYPQAGIDPYIAVCADLLGVHPIEIWDEALTAWRASLR